MSQIIKKLSQKISTNQDKVEEFFAKKFGENPRFFYNSVDLRHSGFKIAPVDTNSFPGGFNNLSKEKGSLDLAKKIADEFFEQNFPEIKKILIIPESHTRNFRYLENLSRLTKEIIGNEKREARAGTLIAEIKGNLRIDLEDGDAISLNEIVKKDGKVQTVDGFIPDLIFLNNDLTEGIPDLFKNISQPIIPSVNMGWWRRKKSQHFEIYNELAKEVAEILEIDPWLISSMHRFCEDVNFKQQIGLDCLAKYVDELLADLRKKYQEHGIDEEPYCYVKADSGTYGMAVWPVFKGEDILKINKKERNKMNMLKGSVQNTKVMIQEGVKTVDKISGNISEPLIYLIQGQVVGNLFRSNESRTDKNSLNSPGASFSDLADLEDKKLEIGGTNKEAAIVYSLVGRLAALAAAIENVKANV